MLFKPVPIFIIILSFEFTLADLSSRRRKLVRKNYVELEQERNYLIHFNYTFVYSKLAQNPKTLQHKSYFLPYIIQRKENRTNKHEQITYAHEKKDEELSFFKYDNERTHSKETYLFDEVEHCKVKLKLPTLRFGMEYVYLCMFHAYWEEDVVEKMVVELKDGKTETLHDYAFMKKMQPITGYVLNQRGSLVYGYIIDSFFYGQVRLFDMKLNHFIVYYIEPLVNLPLYKPSLTMDQIHSHVQSFKPGANACMFEYLMLYRSSRRPIVKEKHQTEYGYGLPPRRGKKVIHSTVSPDRERTTRAPRPMSSKLYPVNFPSEPAQPPCSLSGNGKSSMGNGESSMGSGESSMGNDNKLIVYSTTVPRSPAPSNDSSKSTYQLVYSTTASTTEPPIRVTESAKQLVYSTTVYRTSPPEPTVPPVYFSSNAPMRKNNNLLVYSTTKPRKHAPAPSTEPAKKIVYSTTAPPAKHKAPLTIIRSTPPSGEGLYGMNTIIRSSTPGVKPETTRLSIIHSSEAPEKDGDIIIHSTTVIPSGSKPTASDLPIIHSTTVRSHKTPLPIIHSTTKKASQGQWQKSNSLIKSSRSVDQSVSIQQYESKSIQQYASINQDESTNQTITIAKRKTMMGRSTNGIVVPVDKDHHDKPEELSPSGTKPAPPPPSKPGSTSLPNPTTVPTKVTTTVPVTTTNGPFIHSTKTPTRTEKPIIISTRVPERKTSAPFRSSLAPKRVSRRHPIKSRTLTQHPITQAPVSIASFIKSTVAPAKIPRPPFFISTPRPPSAERKVFKSTVAPEKVSSRKFISSTVPTADKVTRPPKDEAEPPHTPIQDARSQSQVQQAVEFEETRVMYTTLKPSMMLPSTPSPPTNLHYFSTAATRAARRRRRRAINYAENEDEPDEDFGEELFERSPKAGRSRTRRDLDDDYADDEWEHDHEHVQDSNDEDVEVVDDDDDMVEEVMFPKADKEGDKVEVFDLFRSQALLCNLCIWLQPEFALKFGFQHGIAWGAAEIIDLVRYMNWIFRPMDFNMDFQPENIGFRVRKIMVVDIPVVDEIPLDNWQDDARKLMPLVKRAVSDKFPEKCCAILAFVYRNMEPFGSLSSRSAMCVKNKNFALVTGQMRGTKIAKYDVYRFTSHAIGHLIGSLNDDSGDTDCYDKNMDTFNNQFIMHSTHQINIGIRPNAMRMSYCSRVKISVYLSSSRPSCFEPSPYTYCGNGILEDGEDCDCGAPWQCEHIEECCGLRDSFNPCKVINEIPGKVCRLPQIMESDFEQEAEGEF